MTAIDIDDMALAVAAAERSAPPLGRRGDGDREAAPGFPNGALVPHRNFSWKDVGKAVGKTGAFAGSTVLNAYSMGHIADDVVRPLEPRPKHACPEHTTRHRGDLR